MSTDTLWGWLKLGEHTFKKYLSIVCDTPYFPELLRARNDSKSPYYYCVDRSGEKAEKPPSLVETAKREGGRKSSPHARGPLSRSALVRLGNLITPLMKPGYNKVSTLRNRYLRAGHRVAYKTDFFLLSVCLVPERHSPWIVAAAGSRWDLSVLFGGCSQ